jgi:hypothetical protein
VVDYLKTVKTFLDANPNEVLTLLFTNPENLDVKNVWAPAFAATGIDKMAFVPPTPGTPVKAGDWPTLGQMIDSGKRVVVFLDAGADSGAVPYIMPEFQMVRAFAHSFAELAVLMPVRSGSRRSASRTRTSPARWTGSRARSRRRTICS